jgi:pimeloyl-ACP methyl ester carboxylesterase
MSLPHPKWLALEPVRFIPTLYDYLTMDVTGLPRGDEHPVLLLPGLATNDQSTIFIRRRLRQLGYRAFHWKLGWNTRFDEERVENLKKELDQMYAEWEQPISIIGISLGGIYARFLANYAPSKVRQIITLGSPFAGKEPIVTYGSYLYDMLNRDHKAHMLLEKYGGMFRVDPSVPSTSIYSKSDGVVHWKYSLQKQGDQRQNIEVDCGHISLACNPAVINIIADRLQYNKDNWKRYNGE